MLATRERLDLRRAGRLLPVTLLWGVHLPGLQTAFEGVEFR